MNEKVLMYYDYELTILHKSFFVSRTGLKDGKYLEFWKSTGKVKTEGTYKNGQRNGVFIFRRVDGTKKREAIYKEDQILESKEFSPDGKRVCEVSKFTETGKHALMYTDRISANGNIDRCVYKCNVPRYIIKNLKKTNQEIIHLKHPRKLSEQPMSPGVPYGNFLCRQIV